MMGDWMNRQALQSKNRRFGFLLALFALLYIGVVLAFIIAR
jgi:hypothetical protein